MVTWRSDAPPPEFRLGPVNWLVAILKGSAIVVVIALGLLVLITLRGAEIALGHGQRRYSARVPQYTSRIALALLGLRYTREGRPMVHQGAVVANHSSWLDIFSLNAGGPVFFVSKSDVAGWPGIGWLARATGTVFIRRDPRDAQNQRQIFATRLQQGHRLVFFPEGTSSDGRRVLPFKSTLFAAFFDEDLREDMWIQPATLVYSAPEGCDPRFYGWWGDMAFGPHLLAMLGQLRHGAVTVHYHPALKVENHENRKQLAVASEQAVRRAS